MAIRDELYRDMVASREAAEMEARRADRRRWVLVLLVCFAWQIAGGAIVVAAFALMLPPEDAVQLLWAGCGIATAGTILTVALGAPKNGREG
jgi:VIT1/CCC1 family predicted Fe2+/Mn2+ transporter